MSGERFTRAYIDRAAALRAVDRGEFGVAGAGSERSEQGLVSSQQSWDADPVPVRSAGDILKISRRERVGAALRAVEAEETRGRDPAAAHERSARVRAARAQRKEREAEAAAGDEVRPIPRVQQQGRRWLATLANGAGEERQVNSFYARIGRCNKRVKAWAQAIPQMNRRKRRAYKAKGIAPRLVMITLTYADADTENRKSEGWEPKHITGFLEKLKARLKGRYWASAWVAEMQTRGSLHYHVMLYVSPGTDIPMPDKPLEDGTVLWPYGMSKIETAKRGPWYILKYAGKEYQKDGLPAGARMFGVYINKKEASPDELFGFRLSSAPPYVQEAIREYYENGDVPATVRWKRVKGGGWVIVDLGEVLHSEWHLVKIELIDAITDVIGAREPIETVYERFEAMIERAVRG